ncbi:MULTISPECIES: NAD-dependent epimerase/dehydratase family protein [Sutcliffiella]|uniref:Epimerase n=1 Tax=Sutcliffiella cohnii TaxID=33932 RepID=A0A223KMR1_9BACI|nr:MULTISPECIES: NAD-dependent epimerase/dehydratase family protein [Sutcliffiella]AST90648.1 epimerase [Sutcliffiella cohnii]MED4016936.1 NAD-dependent epimerase/dehydratase family protein [Sutcliffiella cohnii]WBL16300.1 NAD-dependent epimerase/dehydratase family protein [Sutcliffiella sp. NC1]
MIERNEEWSKILQEDLEYIHYNLDHKEKFNNSHILITGCAGFLGFYFVHYLLKYQEKLGIKKVIGLDNFLLGKPKWLEKLENQYKDLFQLVQFDISKDKIEEIKLAEDINFVIHMASIASPVFYRKYPVETIDANIWGLRNLLDFYKDSQQVKGILFFSSSEIYGDPSEESIPTKEEYRGNVSCIGPRACYDEAKRFGETLCYVYAESFNMPITIVRPFNNYGPGMKMNDRRVPADFAKSIVNKRNIAIYSSGNPTRTFCYVSDAILGYLKALLYGKFDYFNIGIDNPEISVKELADIYVKHGRKLFNVEYKIEYVETKEKDYLTHNPNRRCPNIEKAKKLLSYKPNIDVNDGVLRFLKFMKEGWHIE